MKYLLTEKEYKELKAKQVNHEHVIKLEEAAKDYVVKNGCNANEGFGYCEECPLVKMPHSKMPFPACIAGEFRQWPK